MTVNPRERTLVVVVLLVIVSICTYALGDWLYRSLQSARHKTTMQHREIEGMRATIARQPEWQQQYDQLRQSLGKSGEEFDQTSDVLKKIEEMSVLTGIDISARKPLPPNDRDLYREFPVECSFETSHESLVRFLVALRGSANLMSVQQLRVAPRLDKPAILRCEIQIRALAAKTEKKPS
jgi:Tfp pilus assembly protein PilO